MKPTADDCRRIFEDAARQHEAVPVVDGGDLARCGRLLRVAETYLHALFAEFHVLNDEVWAKVKDGTYRGFSLEGAFELVPEEMKAIPKTDKNMSKIKRL